MESKGKMQEQDEKEYQVGLKNQLDQLSKIVVEGQYVSRLLDNDDFQTFLSRIKTHKENLIIDTVEMIKKGNIDRDMLIKIGASLSNYDGMFFGLERTIKDAEAAVKEIQALQNANKEGETGELDE